MGTIGSRVLQNQLLQLLQLDSSCSRLWAAVLPCCWCWCWWWWWKVTIKTHIGAPLLQPSAEYIIPATVATSSDHSWPGSTRQAITDAEMRQAAASHQCCVCRCIIRPANFQALQSAKLRVAANAGQQSCAWVTIELQPAQVQLHQM
jgi:hypothetical protein